MCNVSVLTFLCNVKAARKRKNDSEEVNRPSKKVKVGNQIQKLILVVVEQQQLHSVMFITDTID